MPDLRQLLVDPPLADVIEAILEIESGPTEENIPKTLPDPGVEGDKGDNGDNGGRGLGTG